MTYQYIVDCSNHFWPLDEKVHYSKIFHCSSIFQEKYIKSKTYKLAGRMFFGDNQNFYTNFKNHCIFS